MTAVVVVVIGLLSAPAWNKIKGREGVPPNAMPIGISAKQFEWNVTYPGADGKLGTSDDYLMERTKDAQVFRVTYRSDQPWRDRLGRLAANALLEWLTPARSLY